MTIQNSARCSVTPAIVSGPDSCHRMAPNENTDNRASTAPNSNVWPEPYAGLFGWPPMPVVKMSMSCWMRWSGLSIG